MSADLPCHLCFRIVLDEPTNYLDREALGALASALKEYQVRRTLRSATSEACFECL